MMSMAPCRSRYVYALTAGLLLFGLTLPLSKSAGNALLFLIYGVGVAAYLLDGAFRKTILANIRQPLTLPFALLYLVALVGVLFTERYADGFHVANKFISLPVIYLMVSVLIPSLYDEDKRRLNPEQLLISFLVGLMILNMIGVMTFFGILGNKQYVTPLAPLHVHHIWFSNINALGLYTAVSLFLFSPWGKAARRRIFLYCSAAFGLCCILLSLSRTAWFGFALTSAIMAFLVNRNKRILYGAVSGIALAGVVIYWSVPLVHERLDLMASDITLFLAGKTETSLGARFLMWKAAIAMFLSNPLVGVGTGDYVPTIAASVAAGRLPAFLLEYNQPHNMYLFALATNGLVGLASLLYIFYSIMAFALQRIKGSEEERLFSFIAAAVAVHFLIAGCMDSFFNIQLLRYAFVFLMGVCIRNSAASAERG